MPQRGKASQELFFSGLQSRLWCRYAGRLPIRTCVVRTWDIKRFDQLWHAGCGFAACRADTVAGGKHHGVSAEVLRNAGFR